MTGNELATLCEMQAGQAYVWGGLGYKLTESRITQLTNLYPKVYTKAYIEKIKANIGKNAFDCVGLIKHFLWGNVGDGILRKYNASTDYDANTMFKKCTETGKMKELPEIVGLMLHSNGHCGVYLGNGRAVEARGVDYGVVITDVRERNWTGWGKLPNVEYDDEAKTITLAELSELLKRNGITAIII